MNDEMKKYRMIVITYKCDVETILSEVFNSIENPFTGPSNILSISWENA